MTTTQNINRNRRFRAQAYTGAPVNGALGRIIIDLSGMSIEGPTAPIFQQHDPNRIAGQADQIHHDPIRLSMQGNLYANTPAGREVIDLADAGFRWQASVGIAVDAVQELDKGQREYVNQRWFDGPGTVIRKSTLKETSAVPLGADAATSMSIEP